MVLPHKSYVFLQMQTIADPKRLIFLQPMLTSILTKRDYSTIARDLYELRRINEGLLLLHSVFTEEQLFHHV